jgi:hypothetical protein
MLAKSFSQRRLFDVDNCRMVTRHNRSNIQKKDSMRPRKSFAKQEQAAGEIHRIAHMPVKRASNQKARGLDWGRNALPKPSEINRAPNVGRGTENHKQNARIAPTPDRQRWIIRTHSH